MFAIPSSPTEIVHVLVESYVSVICKQWLQLLDNNVNFAYEP